MEQDSKSIVYVHVAPNGKRYVGKTCQTKEQRWRNGAGYRHCPLFYKAIQKFGWENFEHNILADHLTEEEAEILEKQYVEAYQSNNPEYGYNLTSGGEKGFCHSDVVKQKIHNSKLGHEVSEECRRKVSETKRKRYGMGLYDDAMKAALEARKGKPPVNKGKKMDAEFSKKVSEGLRRWREEHPEEYAELHQKMKERDLNGEKNPFFGRHHSEERKRLWSEQKKGVPVSPEHAAKNRVAVLDIKWHEVRCVETGAVYNNYQSARRATGINNASIAKVCKKKMLTAGGYHWEPVTDANRNLEAGKSLDPWWIGALAELKLKQRENLNRNRGRIASERHLEEAGI